SDQHDTLSAVDGETLEVDVRERATEGEHFILAQEFINVMKAAGVVFHQRDGVTARIGPVKVDFARLVALDTLIAQPPRSLSSDMRLIGWIDQTLDVFRRLFR